ncbi:ABC transporter permease [Tabrizicola sp.]|jgi:ribose transport system permease protein|uniref:ABC transporter permease n=1 Tax=Tabrizicola sp. TaxID=2005166 RepID=UPI000BCB722D|nr:ABC transporter permease [Tabrizicola sp.]MBY0349903.1 ABC transporter permease [Tabrizicola sp.]MDK2773790.1 ABC transporter permease [Tabrizicola sp.]OYX18341.1 MAG: ribose ABC transporter permease [Rhodobacterales bacterium 32-66-9]
MRRWFDANAWTLGLAVLLAALLLATKLIQPGFGVSGLDSLARAALPFALATVGMAIVVLAGGIDLSIAAMMAVASVTGAVLMDGASDGQAAFIVLGVLGLGLLMGAVNGLLIVVSRVPDIVVTLAMLFVWQGVALLILNAPGGAAVPWLRALSTGSFPGLDWLPRAVVFLALVTALIWLPIRRAKLGLRLYAIGSDPLAAFRSGVPVGQTRIIAYALCGLFAALGGLSVTMGTGIGEPIPGPYLLASVAAVVLGGVVLGGGRGGILGPVLAVFTLRTVRMDLTLLSVDPNVAAIVEGTIMVAVVMFGAVLAARGRKG